MDTATKVRENKARRAAERQNLFLSKSARRDPRAYDYGLWSVNDLYTGATLTHGYTLTLDEVEKFLEEGQS